MYDEKYYADKKQKKVNSYMEKLERAVLDMTNLMNSAWKDINQIKTEYQELLAEEKLSKEKEGKKEDKKK